MSVQSPYKSDEMQMFLKHVFYFTSSMLCVCVYMKSGFFKTFKSFLIDIYACYLFFFIFQMCHNKNLKAFLLFLNLLYNSGRDKGHKQDIGL